jgi:hypothetical protein
MGTVVNMDRNNKDNEKGTPMAKNTKVGTQVDNVSESTEGSIPSPRADGNVPNCICKHTDMCNHNTQPITDASIGGDILSGMATGNAPPTTESSSMESHEIENDLTSSYHPQTNGLTEKCNGTLTQGISMYVEAHQLTWNEYNDPVLLSYRSIPCLSTGYSPFYLLYGRVPRLPSDVSA